MRIHLPYSNTHGLNSFFSMVNSPQLIVFWPVSRNMPAFRIFLRPRSFIAQVFGQSKSPYMKSSAKTAKNEFSQVHSMRFNGPQPAADRILTSFRKYKRFQDNSLARTIHITGLRPILKPFMRNRGLFQNQVSENVFDKI